MKPFLPSTAQPSPPGKAASELNNLLQIISATSSALEAATGTNDARSYLEMLRASIDRVEKIASDLAEQAGGTSQKISVHPELTAFMRPNEAPPATSASQTIMVVDDEPMLLTLMEQILTDAGFNVVTAQSGFQCLERFRAAPYGFDLIVLDLGLPLMNGEEIFRRVRELRSDIPVLLCTGFIERDRLSGMVSAGLAGFVRKPVASAEMVRVVRSTLQSIKYSRGNAEAAATPALAS